MISGDRPLTTPWRGRYTRTARRTAKFCPECGARLARTCAACGTALMASAASCVECGQLAPGRTPPPRYPDAYTPRHLAEKILTSRAALEGERKRVTVLFADVKGSMELRAPLLAIHVLGDGLTTVAADGADSR